MKSLIKRSKLFRWLASSDVAPATIGCASRPERERAGRRQLEAFPRLYPSQLEPRIVLNASPVVQLDPSGVLSVDAGDCADDGSADTFEVHLAPDDADTINISVNGTLVYSGAVADVQSIQVNGSGDADQLTLDAAVLDRVSVAFDPGSASEFRDTVQLSAEIGGTWQAVSVELNSAGGDVHLTRNDGVLSAGLSFTGTVDVIDSLAVADRTLSLGDLTSVIVTGQDGELEVQSSVGTLLFVHADQAAWEIDASGGTLQFDGTIALRSLSGRAENITVSGTLTATEGALVFEAQDHFQLETSGHLITTEHSITMEAEHITLAGTIEARNGGDVFATAGENGILRASGLIDASDERVNGTGGRVFLDGGQVILSGTAEVNVSGTEGGGEIHLGGSRDDDTTLAPETTLTYVGPETRLIADALESGDGGKVILWSDDSTLLAGTISARGGAASGNGGWIEVSGKQRFWFGGQIDTSANSGQVGTLLVDPTTINIVAGAPGSGTLDEELTLSDPAILEAVLNAGANTLSVGQLQTLGSGNHVVLEATTQITVSAPLDLDLGATGSLTLRATAGSVVFNAAVNITGGDLVVEALTTISVNAAVEANGGDITFTANQIILNGSVVTHGTGALSIQGDVSLAGNSLLGVQDGDLIVSGTINGARTLTISADSGEIQFQGEIGGTVALASLSITSSGTVEFQDDVRTTGTQQISAATVYVAQSHSTSNALLSISGNTILQGDTAFSTGGGNLVLDSISGGGHDLQLISGAGATTVTGTVSGIAELKLQQDVASSTGAITFQGNLSVATLTTFARNYAVYLIGTNTTITNAVTFTNTGGVRLGDGADVLNFSGGLTSTASTTTVNGTVTTANQQVTFGNLRIGGDSVVSTGGGNFQVNGSLNSTGNGAATSDENSLTVSAGNGDVLFLGTIGGAADGALGDLQVTARTIEVSNIGTLGTVGVVGATQLTAQAGITLTGALIRTAGSQRYEGSVTIDSASDLFVVTTGGGVNDRIVFTGNVGHVAGWTSQFIARTSGTSAIEFGAAIDVDGNLLLDAGGDLTVAGAVNTGGTLTMLGSNIHLQSDIYSAGAVSISADNALTLGGGLDASNQTIVLRANQDNAGNQGFTQAAGKRIQTTNAANNAIQILVGGNGNAALATVIAESGGIQVQAGGRILSNGAALDPQGNAVNLITNDLVLIGGSGIEVSTNVNTIDATVSAAGDLEIDQFSRDLTVKNLKMFAGDATIRSDAVLVLQTLSLPGHALTLDATNVRFEQPVSNLHDLTVNAQGAVDFLAALTTTGSVVVDTAGDVTFQGPVSLGGGLDVSGDAVTLLQDVVTSGAIQIAGQNELSIGVNLDAGAATITLLANQDQSGGEGFIQTEGTTIRTSSAANNAITIRAGGTGDVLLSRVEASAGGVSITAGGAIADYGPPGSSVLASSLTATAVAGIDLHTDIDAFSGTITGPGGMLRLVEADTLQINSISVAGGDVSISADTLSIGAIVTSGDVMLTARTGAITDGNGALLNITADALVLSSLDGVDLQTRVNSLDLTLSGSGDVHIAQSDRALTVVNLVVPDGDVSLLSNSAVTLLSFDIPAHHLTVSGSDISFAIPVQGVSDLTVSATGDVVFQGLIDITHTLDVDADGDVTFHASVLTGGALTVTGDQVWFTQSLTTGGSIQVSARNELRFSGDVDAGDQTITLRANQDGTGTQGLVLHGVLKTLNASVDALVINVQGSGSVLVDAIDVGGGVNIQAGGALRGFNQATTEILAARLQVIAGTGMDVWTTATEVSAEVTQIGDILMSVADAVTVERMVTNHGSIEFVSGNTMWLGIVTAGAGGDLTLTAQTGSILALANDPAISLVRAGLLTLTAPGEITLQTDVSSLIATISGSGSLTIDNQGTLSVIAASVHDGNAAVTAASLEIGLVAAPGAVALTATSGGIFGVSESAHVSTGELILASTGSIILTTDIDFLQATISQEGNLRINDIGQLQVDLVVVNFGAIDLAAAQELLIAGCVVTEQGQISLMSENSNLRFFNPHLDKTLLVYSGGSNARIEGSAGGDVIITGPGIVLFRTPLSQYFTVRPDLSVKAQDVPFFTDVQVTPEGWTTLCVSFGEPSGPQEYYFRLIIDWGDTVETITAAEADTSLTPLQRAGQDSEKLNFKIRHQYLDNPNVHDPTAPIPVSIIASNSLIDGGPADIVFFADGNRTDPLVTQVGLLLNVPATGLTIAFAPVLPPAAEAPETERSEPISEPPAATVIADSSRSTQPLVTSTQAIAVYERYYVLRIVVQIDEEGNTRELADIRIDDEYLRNLPKLFEMLPDDRYRLYQIREDGVAQLITDVIVRGGKSVGNIDLDEGLKSLEDQGSTLNELQSPADLWDDSPEMPVDLRLQSSLLNDPQGSQSQLITKAGVLQLRNW